MKRVVQLEESWLAKLKDEFDKDYMQELRSFLQSEIEVGKVIYPRPSEYFNALNSTPFEKVKVVILGQDPYHGAGQAHGLCFSVRKGVPLPPSLKNIYKELQDDLGIRMPSHGCLTEWAEQGVLLLNSVLTVEAGLAASHQNRGWEWFTDAVIHRINEQNEHVVFLLWGSYAQKKGAFIDKTRHLVLQSVHPSPLSAHRGFFGQRCFSKANAYLVQHGKSPVDWSLEESHQTLFSS